jgi:hypothetical protein
VARVRGQRSRPNKNILQQETDEDAEVRKAALHALDGIRKRSSLEDKNN